MFLNWIGIAVGLTIWGGLYSAYYYQARTRYLETERARLLAASREAQLMTLKGQLNPHFLFNSLNTLRALIQREPKAARDAVTHLADMMRYSLTLSDFPIIPLAAELNFVNDYLALEHLRHEDRLRIKQRIAPEALRENIPPMLLLTLVENAVKHGLNQRSGGIDVVCEIWLEPPAGDAGADNAKMIHLRVTNQGFLVLADKPVGEDAPPTTGTGLRNISERLRLLYGDRASLAVSQQEDHVVAEVVLPAVPASANGVDFLIAGEKPALNPDTQP
ncbi:sensor histidine kinase [Ereboglobus luteus]|uniref:sensor histidine kinase n=1 Tax=Ereboglobus luteus TaxID=1796921 RepID=UPI001F00BF30|nr:histidine kinase [Ereboglobus luteus]